MQWMKWNAIVGISEWKQEDYFYDMQDFLFLLCFGDSLCFAEFDIFTWFNDTWDVAINLSIAVTFFGVWQYHTFYFDLSSGKSLKKLNTNYIKIREIV